MFIVVKCEDHSAIQAPPQALPDKNLKMPGIVFFCYKSIQKSMKPAYIQVLCLIDGIQPVEWQGTDIGKKQWQPVWILLKFTDLISETEARILLRKGFRLLKAFFNHNRFFYLEYDELKARKNVRRCYRPKVRICSTAKFRRIDEDDADDDNDVYDDIVVTSSDYDAALPLSPMPEKENRINEAIEMAGRGFEGLTICFPLFAAGIMAGSGLGQCNKVILVEIFGR